MAPGTLWGKFKNFLGLYLLYVYSIWAPENWKNNNTSPVSSGVQYFLAIWWDWAHSAAVNGWCLRTRRRRYQRLVHQQRGRRRFFWKSARAYDYALSRAAKTILLQSVILLCALLFYCVWFSLLSIELYWGCVRDCVCICSSMCGWFLYSQGIQKAWSSSNLAALLL